MKPQNSQRYLLAEDFDERSKDLSMRRSSWTLISAISQLQLDGSFQEFCADISLSQNEANSVIVELLDNQLIYENRAAAEETRLVATPIRELLKGTFSTLALGMFSGEGDVSQTKTMTNSSTAIKMRLGEYQKYKKSQSMVQNWIWDSGEQSSPSSTEPASTQKTGPDNAKPQNLTSPKSTEAQHSATQVKGPNGKKPDTKKYKLQPIISQIEKLSSGGVEGSVLVYQVFLKVPTDLLQSEGIESLKLVDANTEFTSQKLCQAIVRATAQITGYNLKIVGYNR